VALDPKIGKERRSRIPLAVAVCAKLAVDILLASHIEWSGPLVGDDNANDMAMGAKVPDRLPPAGQEARIAFVGRVHGSNDEDPHRSDLTNAPCVSVPMLQGPPHRR
jgi:hypothetical protein